MGSTPVRPIKIYLFSTELILYCARLVEMVDTIDLKSILNFIELPVRFW